MIHSESLANKKEKERFVRIIDLFATRRLFAQQTKDLLFDPFFVMWLVFSRWLLKDQTAQIRQLIDEFKQLGNIIGDGR